MQATRRPRTFLARRILRHARFVLFSLLLFGGGSILASAARQQKAPAALLIRTVPGAIVWLDEVRRGVTDSTGVIKLAGVKRGRHLLRVRAAGFREVSRRVVSPSAAISVRLTRTTDEAELLFQQAEAARETARDAAARELAVELYRRATSKRTDYPAAYAGLARVLLDLGRTDEALNVIEQARAFRPVYPEASAVEGRIFREKGITDAAILSFEQAIEEARGFQPEAHTGLALVYQEQGEYDDAIRELRTALAQLSDTEPVLYQVLGAIYEKLERHKEAVAAYEKYLLIAPAGSFAPAIRSIIDQLKRDAASQRP